MDVYDYGMSMTSLKEFLQRPRSEVTAVVPRNCLDPLARTRMNRRVSTGVGGGSVILSAPGRQVLLQKYSLVVNVPGTGYSSATSLLILSRYFHEIIFGPEIEPKHL